VLLAEAEASSSSLLCPALLLLSHLSQFHFHPSLSLHYLTLHLSSEFPESYWEHGTDAY
jgi:hypothetical protein